MLVACAALISTLRTLQIATAIGVTGACPAYMQILSAPPGAVLDFSQATPSRLDLFGVSGITVQNYTSVGTTYSALNVVNSTQILLSQIHMISPGTAGITIQGSNTVEVAEAWITGSSGDGIDIAGSTNVNVHDGACEGNVPTSIHADCVQLWSVTGYPVQHIMIQNMTAIGQTQGFDLWDHSDYGATDIQFINNHASLTQSNCIGAYYAHNLVVEGNDCHTLTGSQTSPRLNIQFSPGAIIEYNTVGAPVAQPVVQ